MFFRCVCDVTPRFSNKEKSILYTSKTIKKMKAEKSFKNGKGKGRLGKSKVAKKYLIKDKDKCFHYGKDGHCKRNYEE